MRRSSPTLIAKTAACIRPSLGRRLLQPERYYRVSALCPSKWAADHPTSPAKPTRGASARQEKPWIFSGLALDLAESVPQKAQSNSLAVRAYLGRMRSPIENKDKIVGIFVVTEGSGAYLDSAIRFYTPTEALKTYVYENYLMSV